MSERLIHPIDHYLLKTPKTVIDLLDEHYSRDDIDVATLLHACHPNNYDYIKHLAALTLKNHTAEMTDQSIGVASNIFHFAHTIGALAGLDEGDIRADYDTSVKQDPLQVKYALEEQARTYIDQNKPVMNLLSRYHAKIDRLDSQSEDSIRTLAATVMRHMQEGNERAVANLLAREANSPFENLE